MASAIDPTKPEDGVPANKAELRANLAAASLRPGLMAATALR